MEELLPEVKKLKTVDGRAIRISDDPNDRGIGGASSGAICAFTAAWQRPDAFSRVFSAIGTYVAMRGGDQYPALIRKTAPKCLRIFLQDGSNDTWNPLFGNWFTGNLNMEAALRFANYEVEHRWGTGGHDGVHAMAIFPDAMCWLWKDWPKRIEAGVSNNDMLQAILTVNDWEEMVLDFLPAGLMNVMPDGDLVLNDTEGHIRRIARQSAQHSQVLINQTDVQALNVGPNGAIYTIDSTHKSLFAFDQKRKSTRLGKGIDGKHLMITAQNAIYLTEANEKGEGKLLLIKSGDQAAREIADIPTSSGIAISPDRTMIFVGSSERSIVYNGIMVEDGSVKDMQKWCWLHNVGSMETGITDMVMDNEGNLYVGSEIGVQVCDQNGRVRAILAAPEGEKIKSLCFGDKDHKTLFILTDKRLYGRRMKVNGISSWSEPVKPKSIGAG